MPVSWPTGMPCQPVVGSFSVTPETNVVTFAPDVGSPLRRKRYTASRRLYQGDIAMTPTQANDLLDFYVDDCSDGVTSFWMNDWITGESKQFSWVSTPTINKAAAGLWRASLSLAKEP